MHAFQSDVIYAIFQNFNPREEINPPQHFKIRQFCFAKKQTKKEYLATNTSCIQSDLNTLHIDSGSLMLKLYSVLESLQEQVVMVRYSAGEGWRKQSRSRHNAKMLDWMVTVESKSQIQDILGDLDILFRSEKRMYGHPNQHTPPGVNSVWGLLCS